MILKRFTDFRKNYNVIGDQLNENIQQAKTYIRNIALDKKKTKLKDSSSGLSKEEIAAVGLTKAEVSQADNQEEFQKILAVVKDVPGLAYLFTKIYYEHLDEPNPESKIESLVYLLGRLKKHRNSLGELPMPADRYVSKAACDEEDLKSEQEGRQKRSAYERLDDDLTKLENSVITNKWVGQLVSFQKAWMTKLSPFQREKIDGIAKAFDFFGTEDGVKDKAANKALQDVFFGIVTQFKTLNDLIRGAEDYIKAANNAGRKKFLLAIDKVNKKFGFKNGAEIVFTKDSILIIEVKSYPANVDLNANTSHCITKSPGHWETYVGLEKFTKQYYIYDFDLPPNDNYSVIGITIGEKGRITACHLKDDKAFGNEIVAHMKKKGIEMDVMPPLSTEEIELRKKRIVASKEIVKPNLTLDQVKSFIESGADPNTNGGRPLENAVKEDDYKKTEYLLSVGAMPSINNPIKYAKNLEMIKLLVEHGCALTTEIFSSIINDYESVKFVLQKGFDPNFEKGYPLRAAVRVNNLQVIELLVQNGAKIDERRYMVVKQCVESGSTDILKILLTELQKSDSNFKNSESRAKLINEWKAWNNSSLQTKADLKEEIVQILDSFQ